MVDTSVANSTQNLSEEEYKKLCKQVRQHQIKKAANRKGEDKKFKPILIPLGNTIQIKRDILVEESLTDWSLLPVGAPFSLDTKGITLYTKAGKHKAMSLNTMSPAPVSSGKVHRVFL